MKIIYDFGANAGQNIDYYLNNSDLVIAVEANPELAKKINIDFKEYILNNKLIVFNKCLVNNKIENKVAFYLNRRDSGLSSFIKPNYNENDFDVIMVDPITYEEIVKIVGKPYYVKIDLEGLDEIILKSILDSGIIPNYLSFENGVSYTKRILKECNAFKSYNIVAFYNFKKVYGKIDGKTAGPFGADIKSPWLNKDSILKLINKMPTTWFDIHLSTDELDYGQIDFKYYKKDFNLVLAIKQAVPNGIRKILIKYLK